VDFVALVILCVKAFVLFDVLDIDVLIITKRVFTQKANLIFSGRGCKGSLLKKQILSFLAEGAKMLRRTTTYEPVLSQ
jgi:hypothetical protein